jgi:hypothetical protein
VVVKEISMSDIKTAVRTVSSSAGPSVVLSQAEQDQRREQLRRAYHESLIEGGTLDPATDYIREAFIRGEVDTAAAIAMVKSHYGLPRKPR